MKWSIRIGRWFGIDVYLHVTFLLILGFLGVLHWMRLQNVGAVIEGLLFFLAIFLCVLLHEFGHALTAKRFGIRTRDITLLPIGGVARLERLPQDPIQELWIALAGPAVNVVVAVLLSAWLAATGSFQPVAELDTTTGGFAQRLLIVNLFLVFFNMLPAFPMDGGRVLRALLAIRMDYARATRIAATIGQGMALLFGFLGLFGNPMLLFIALFVWIGASQEAGIAQVRSSIAGTPVSQAMLTQYEAISPQDTLHRVVQLILAGSQADFPVVNEDRVVGLLERRTVIEALARSGPDTRVEDVMRRDFTQVDANDLLEDALVRQRSSDLPMVPVTRNGRLVGLLTMENLSEYLLIQSALGTRRPTPPS
jgi:Zn-dependent protease